MNRFVQIGLLAWISFLSGSLNAQVFYNWGHGIGSNQHDIGQQVVLDTAGNVIVAGTFSGTADFDPGPGTSSLTNTMYGPDIFILKLDSLGNFIWIKQLAGTATLDLGGLVCDHNNNIFLAGRYTDTLDLDPGPGTYSFTSLNGSVDAFMVKLNATGDLIWAKNFVGSGGCMIHDLALDDSGHVYGTGQFLIDIDCDPGPATDILNTAGGVNSFVVKLDTNGNYIWGKPILGSDYVISYALDTDPFGNLVIGGDFQDSVDFDPGTGIYTLSAQSTDGFICKLNSHGNLIWAHRIGDLGNEEVNDISINNTGDIHITGTFSQNADFDPGPGVNILTNSGVSNCFILKFDPAGNLIWAKTTGSPGNAKGNTLFSDGFKNLFIAGYFTGTTDFDPGPGTLYLTSGGSYDVFIQKLDVSGNLLWARTFGGGGVDMASDIYVDISENVYSTGYFQSTADLDPGPAIVNKTAQGQYDIYIQKLSRCVSQVTTDTIVACDSYTWIDGITYTSGNNTAMVTYVASNGCDSAVLLDLTIHTVDSNVTITNTTTLTALTTATNYQWLDCNNGYAQIPGATGQSYTPASNGSYAVAISNSGCTDTSACFLIDQVGINSLERSNISVYPNPVNSSLTIKLKNIETTVFELRDVSGRLIRTWYTSGNRFTADVSNLENGTYILSAEGYNTRIVKQ